MSNVQNIQGDCLEIMPMLEIDCMQGDRPRRFSFTPVNEVIDWTYSFLFLTQYKVKLLNEGRIIYQEIKVAPQRHQKTAILKALKMT